MKPTLGRIVHYRGKFGLQAMRAAIVCCDINGLDPRGVESGDIPGLDSDMHVHLTVFTPGEQGAFTEYNVAYGGIEEEGPIAAGTWTWPLRV